MSLLTNTLQSLHAAADYTLGTILNPLITYLFILIAVSSFGLFIGIVGIGYGKLAWSEFRRREVLRGRGSDGAVLSAGEGGSASETRPRTTEVNSVLEGKEMEWEAERERGRAKMLITRRGERLKRRAGY